MSVIHISGNASPSLTHMFWCPGYDRAHGISEGTWSFNGNLEQPTFTPSVLVRGSAWQHYCCHSFVTDGRIEFLSDSTHTLAGQTVDLPQWPIEDAHVTGAFTYVETEEDDDDD